LLVNVDNVEAGRSAGSLWYASVKVKGVADALSK
jgi:hypothetical protein